MTTVMTTTMTLLSLGIFGLLGMTVLCPLIALVGYSFQHQYSRKILAPREGTPAPAPSVEIILPAHNEAGVIGATLISIQRSVQFLKASKSHPSQPIVVRVGADGCTDQTLEVARQFPTVSVREFPEKGSKWGTIKALLSDSVADWVILVDAGTLWPENFLFEFVQRIENEHNVIAIAPSYQPLRAGRLSKFIWQIEASLKKMEEFCGGPVSLHGATIGYKRASLENVWTYLGDTVWLNDDVVIPLVLRAVNPNGVILYPVGKVQDAGAQNRVDLGRRKRMLLGNLQWIIFLLPVCFRLNSIAGIVATRRLFRLFWAYWFGFIVFGLTLAFHFLVIPELAILIILIALSGSVRQMIGAAWVSFLTPYRMLRLERPFEVSWK